MYVCNSKTVRLRSEKEQLTQFPEQTKLLLTALCAAASSRLQLTTPSILRQQQNEP